MHCVARAKALDEYYALTPA